MIEHILLAPEVSEDLAVVTRSIVLITADAGQNLTGVPVKHLITIFVHKLSLKCGAASDLYPVGGIAVVARADEKIPI